MSCWSKQLRDRSVDGMNLHGVIWVLFVVCLVVSFVLSGMEAAVFALSRLRIRRQMHAGRRSARALHEYLEHPENFLWTILVGNTVANFIILGWAIKILHDALKGQRLWFIIIFAVIVFLFYTFFDLLPKMLFRVYPNRLGIILARPFGLIHLLLRPLVALVEGFSSVLLQWRGGKVFTGHLFGNREELRLVMQESGQGFSSEERAMINRVLDLQTLTVRQVMKPMDQATTITTKTTVEEGLVICREQKFTRMPVWEERDGLKRIVGLLNCNRLLFETEGNRSKPAGDYVTPALYLAEDLRLEVALQRMQRAGQRLAIVLGRDQRETGIVSLQDILKLVFGEVSL